MLYYYIITTSFHYWYNTENSAVNYFDPTGLVESLLYEKRITMIRVLSEWLEKDIFRFFKISEEPGSDNEETFNFSVLIEKKKIWPAEIKVLLTDIILQCSM